MPSYRFYPLDRAGRIVAPANDRDLRDDAAACDYAHQMIATAGGPEAAQVWQGHRLVHCATRAVSAV